MSIKYWMNFCMKQSLFQMGLTPRQSLDSVFCNITFKSDIKTVWDIVTDVEKYSRWRSDLNKSELVDDGQFIEYTKEGYATYITVTNTEIFKRWEFNMKNSNMIGHWIGKFTAKGNTTEVEFIEEVDVKNIFMRLFAKGYLKRRQTSFIADLKKILG